MIQKDYKIIISVLFATNVICFVIVYFLCGEIYSLQEKLSDTMETVLTLQDKISRIEIEKEKNYGDIVGVVLTVIAVVIVSIYFGGPGEPNWGDEPIEDIAKRALDYLIQSILDEFE